MHECDTMFDSEIAGLQKIARGKVRDIYNVDENHLLMVATDRLSAYDVVLPDPVPGKGRILTGISEFWFAMMQDLVPNHLTDRLLSNVISHPATLAAHEGRAIICRKLQPLPIESVVRGYLIGSGWRDYERTGAVCGIRLPEGLRQADKLPEILFTPATKAAAGDHDENISYQQAAALIGDDLVRKVRDLSVQIYERASAHALKRGIIIADTKFEFGLDEHGKLFLIDEVLTPDSSRFWPLSEYQPGSSPPSFDKQFIRDYLDTLDWDKKAPGPSLPKDIIARSADKYREAMAILTI